MTKPTIAQLVDAIRVQLSDVVLPAVDDPATGKALGMIDHLLQTIAVRAEHEIDWMVTYAADVVALAEEFVTESVATETVSEALAAYRAGRCDSLATSAVTANYALAADVLSAMLEGAVTDQGPLAVRARDLLRRDVAHGVDVVGDFELIPP